MKSREIYFPSLHIMKIKEVVIHFVILKKIMTLLTAQNTYLCKCLTLKV